MTEPTTAEGRALLGLDMTPESGYWVNLGAYEMRAAILAIEAAAAEAERARTRAALSKPHQAWCSALLGPCDCGHDSAAIDDEAKDRADPRADGRLTEAYADGYVDGRMDATPDLAAIDDEAKG